MRKSEARALLSSEPLSLEEVNRRYPSEWVLLKVTGVDDRGLIVQGEVLDHSPQRGKLNRAVKRLCALEPDAHLFVFLGGTQFGAGESLRDALADIAERGEIDARW